MLEVLMHWVIVDIVVAVLVGTKLNDECVGDPVLDLMLVTSLSKISAHVPVASQSNCLLRQK
jgi:hypothetical protein